LVNGSGFCDYSFDAYKHCRDSECFTVYCGKKPFNLRYNIEKDDVSDEEIQAYVQKVMDKNEWEL